MGSRQNKSILLFLSLLYFTFGTAQTFSDSIIYSETEYDEMEFPDTAGNIVDQKIQNEKLLKERFDRAYWEDLIKDQNFEEDSLQPAKKKIKPQPKRNSSFQFPKIDAYVWIIAALVILALVLIRIQPTIFNKKTNNNQKLVTGHEALEEEEIRQMDIDSALDLALKEENYKLAYRIRYLSVLKKLIEANLVLYRKEKTNYDYLIQLSGKPVSEPFRLLTFNFDGIWYGDFNIDKDKYQELDIYFEQFNSALKKV